MERKKCRAWARSIYLRAVTDTSGAMVAMRSTPMSSPFVSLGAARNRREITALMARHGFDTCACAQCQLCSRCFDAALLTHLATSSWTADPWEFWHYNAGDAYSEHLHQTGRPGRYGAVSLDPATGEVKALARLIAPLNTVEFQGQRMEKALQERASL
jgi:hypothetical protein